MPKTTWSGRHWHGIFARPHPDPDGFGVRLGADITGLVVESFPRKHATFTYLVKQWKSKNQPRPSTP